MTVERPDAIVTGNDIAAAKLHGTLAAIGKGGDIRLAGFDDVAVAAQLGLTTCRQHDRLLDWSPADVTRTLDFGSAVTLTSPSETR